MSKATIAIAMLMVILWTSTGCEQQGTAEKAGEKVDQALQESQNKVETAVEGAGEKLEAAGDKLQEKTQ